MMYIHLFAGGCWRVKDAQPGLLAKLLTIAQGGTAAQGGQGTPAAQLQVADLLGPTGTAQADLVGPHSRARPLQPRTARAQLAGSRPAAVSRKCRDIPHWLLRHPPLLRQATREGTPPQ